MRLPWWSPALLLFALATGLMLRQTPVLAQSEPLEFDVATPTESQIPADGGVSAEEIEAATTAYFSAVETYRLEENRYALARDQYYQLNTAASLDEAIRRSKEVLRARAEVLLAYFSYLRLTLQNTKGIDLNDKARADQQLATWQAEYETYVQKIPPANDRQQINVLFEEINGKAKDIRNAAYGTLILIKLGEIQTAIDTATLLQQRTADALEQSETVPAANKEIGRRGLAEITTLLQRARNNMIALREDYREGVTRGTFSESAYRTFQNNADFSYIQLRQVVDFLREVQKGL